jgi:cytochrome oxidase assembly protein ShyY1
VRDVPAAAGPTDLVGWLQPSDGTVSADDDPSDDVFPQLRVADLAQRYDDDLYGAYVVVRDPTDGLVQADLEELPDAGRFTALRNLLYAVEWWFFGAFAAFVWWRWAREEAEAVAAASTATLAADGSR